MTTTQELNYGNKTLHKDKEDQGLDQEWMELHSTTQLDVNGGTTAESSSSLNLFNL